jgi:hypothetical protein
VSASATAAEPEICATTSIAFNAEEAPPASGPVGETRFGTDHRAASASRREETVVTAE